GTAVSALVRSTPPTAACPGSAPPRRASDSSSAAGTRRPPIWPPASRTSPMRTGHCCNGPFPSSSGWWVIPNDAAQGSQQEDLLVPSGPQLPPLLLRPVRVDDRHVDAVPGPGLARLQHPQQP